MSLSLVELEYNAWFYYIYNSNYLKHDKESMFLALKKLNEVKTDLRKYYNKKAHSERIKNGLKRKKGELK